MTNSMGIRKGRPERERETNVHKSLQWHRRHELSGTLHERRNSLKKVVRTSMTAELHSRRQNPCRLRIG